LPIFCSISLSFAAKQNRNIAESDANCRENVNKKSAETIFVKIEEDKYAKTNKSSSSQFIGVSYNDITRKWRAQRRSKHDKKISCNGSYEDEETAAHASDTLARKFMKNGEKNHKLNFSNDYTEVFLKKKENSSQFIGVNFRYDFKRSNWQAHRRSKHDKKVIYNGSYDNEEAAAHASDTLARKLMENGEQCHKLNFPDDNTDVFSEEKKGSSQYIGVMYDVKTSKWRAQRRSKHDKKITCNGSL
jgi:hypothetical protein